MDILLISPDYNNKVNNFPWGIMSTGSYLNKTNQYKIKLLDASIYSDSDFYYKVKNYCKNVKLIGISTMSTDVYFVKNLVDFIKNVNSKVKIIIGGAHAMLCPEQTCSYENIDFVAYGEGEYTLLSLIEKINKNDNNYESVLGLIYKEENKIKKTILSEPVEFYNINYGLVSKAIEKSFSDYIQVLTGRGCSFKCTFCFNSVCGQKWRPRPMVDIINEIENIINKYNSKIIYFRDDNFFQSKERIRQFISYYKEKKFTFKWRANCRAAYYNNNYINDKLLKELESINCQVLKFGLESGSQRVLDYLKKNSTVENTKRLACGLARVKKIRPEYSFMMGIPEESTEEYAKTLNLVKYVLKYNPQAKIIGPQYFRIYPGGELYEDIKNNYGYSEPESFEGWAERFPKTKEGFGYEKNIVYSWIPRGCVFLAQNAEALVFLYRKRIAGRLNLKVLFQYFFVALARLRFKRGWYGYLYDIRLYVFLKRLKRKLTFL